MRRRSGRVSLAALAGSLGLLLAATLPATAAAAPDDPDYAAARSTLHTDSVYPKHGTTVIDTLHYHLDLTWQPKPERLIGVETVVFRVARSHPRFALDLSTSLEVSTVRIDGHPERFSQRKAKLIVASPVREGTRHRLVVRYAGTPTPIGEPTTRSDLYTVGFTITGDHGAWTQQEPYGASTWYAVNDQPADKAYYDFTLHVPASWRGIANGRLVGNRVSGQTRTMHWHLGQPTAAYLTTVAFGRYRLHHAGTVHGVPLTYWTPRSFTRSVPSLRHLGKELRWVERRLGRYPFPSLGVLVVPDEVGMETQTMITLGSDHYDLEPQTVVHEIAHQWYGDEVTPDDWRDLWMNEGMAMFIQDLWLDHVSGDKPGTATRAAARWDDQVRSWWGPPGDYDSRDFAEENVYDPPATMWLRLEHRLGHRLFWRLVRAWPRSHALTSTDRDVLAAWWSSRSGQNLRPFFHRWLMDRKDPN